MSSFTKYALSLGRRSVFTPAFQPAFLTRLRRERAEVEARFDLKDHDYLQRPRLRFKVHVLEHDWT